MARVGQPLKGQILRLRVDEVVLEVLRLQDPGGGLSLLAHPVADEEDHVLGHSFGWPIVITS